MKGPVITIDGPAGVGKSTLAQALAEELGYTLLESGALYRAVGLAALERGIAADDEAAAEALVAGLEIELSPGPKDGRVFLSGVDVTDRLREEAVGNMASAISKLDVVREAMTDLQRRLARDGRVVVEGRDAGTVVFPQAEVKFFLDASLAERARRRVAQLAEKGIEVDYARVEAEMAARDEQDSTRSLAPLRPAEGAIVIDTTSLSPAEVLARMIKEVRKI